MKMSVSQIINENGQKKAYILFSDKKRSAEIVFPDGTLIKNNGFNDEEIDALKTYMQEESDTIKELAASVNLWKAFQK